MRFLDAINSNIDAVYEQQPWRVRCVLSRRTFRVISWCCCLAIYAAVFIAGRASV